MTWIYAKWRPKNNKKIPITETPPSPLSLDQIILTGQDSGDLVPAVCDFPIATARSITDDFSLVGLKIFPLI